MLEKYVSGSSERGELERHEAAKPESMARSFIKQSAENQATTKNAASNPKI